MVLDQLVLEKHSTKSKRSRTIHLSQQAITFVQSYLNSRKIDSQAAQTPLFPRRKSPQQPLSPNSASFILKKMFDIAGLENVSSHSMRRTHANMLRRHRDDLKIIQQQLGHSSLAITERYFEVDPLEMERAVQQRRVATSPESSLAPPVFRGVPFSFWSAFNWAAL